MKWFAGMITKLMVDNDFITTQEAPQTREEFDTSFEEQMKSSNKISQKLNSFFKHPLGVLSTLFVFVKIRRMMKDSQAEDEDNDFQIAYKKAIQEKMIEDAKKGE